MKAPRWVAVGGLALSVTFLTGSGAQDLPVVADATGMMSWVGQTWTNNPAAKLFLPGKEFELKLGGVAFQNTFETNLLNSLIPVTNDTVVLYPVLVVETNLPSRQRIFFNADAVAVQTSAVNDVNYPDSWIEEVFGQPPGYLAGAKLDAWYAARDPARCSLVFDLLSTSDVPAYVAMLTSGVSERTSTQTWEDLLILYSNDIAAVEIREAAGTVGVYVHAPADVSLLDVFSSPDLLDTNAWVHRGVYAHTVDPMLFVDAPFSQITYTAADALGDEDGDTLASGREIFIYHTSATTNDSDGDLLEDNLELLVYSTNPNVPDSDGDGVLDGAEVAANLNPTAADTDGDWFADGYELAQQTSPVDPGSHPPYHLQINGGALYVQDPAISVELPGLVAEEVLLGPGPFSDEQQTHPFSTNLAYQLEHETNGPHVVYARLRRDNGAESSDLLSGTVTLDSVPPALAVTNPPVGSTTDQRWIDLAGTVTDEASHPRVLINGEFAHYVFQGEFRHPKILLAPGTNDIELVASDWAGNASTTTYSIVQDLSTDSSAPSVQFELPLDMEVVGASTNLFSYTTVGADAELYLHGSTDDPTAHVRVALVHGMETGSIYQISVSGTSLWGTVHLSPGTNVLAVTAEDAAGNLGTTNYTVVRDESYFLRITNPAPYEVALTKSLTVSGVASPQFSNAVISINGQPTALEVRSNEVGFVTTSPVPLTDGLNRLEGFAELDGRRWYFDPPVLPYPITVKANANRVESWISSWRLLPALGLTESMSHHIIVHRQTWTSETEIDYWVDEAFKFELCSRHNGSAWDCSDDPETTVARNQPGWPIWLSRFGTAQGEGNTPVPGQSHDIRSESMQSRISYLHTGTGSGTENVVLSLFGYVGDQAESLQFRGRPSFLYNQLPSFVLPLPINEVSHITTADFYVPPQSIADTYYATHSFIQTGVGQLIQFWLPQVIPIRTDLHADTNRDGVITEQDDNEEGEDRAPGLILQVNDNDSNTNGVPDLEETDYADDADLHRVALHHSPTNLPGHQLRLNLIHTGTGRLNVWAGDKAGTPLLDERSFTHTWDLDTDSIPEELTVEATATSSDIPDIRLELAYLDPTGTPLHSDTNTFTVLEFDLVPDWNRDKRIDTADENQATTSNPFRFWKNDDNDKSADAKTGGDDDLPGALPQDAGYENIDGVRDVIDFFPVFVNLKNTLDHLGTSDYNYVLKYDGIGSVGLVYTDLTPDMAGNYLSNPSLAENLVENATVHTFSSQQPGAYLTLEQAFLDKIQNEGRGIILVEMSDNGGEPLRLEIHDSSDNVAVFTELALSISGVEQMFRRLNLVDVLDGDNALLEEPAALTTISTKPPNSPTSESATTFAFVHGFNVSQQASRAWQSEIFKRLFHSGSDAKFVGVTWHGDVAPNYHKAVINAFATSENLDAELQPVPGRLVVGAHSLGNIVVSSAITDHGLQADQYFLFNAAVTTEAYEPNPGVNTLMRPASWDQVPEQYWASFWHQQFSDGLLDDQGNPVFGDARQELTWQSRFQAVNLVAYNFYSPGEDVVRNSNGSVLGMIGAAALDQILSEFGEYSWPLQEMLKGNQLLDTVLLWDILADQHGGWSFNPIYSPPPTNLSLPDGTVRTTPVFWPFIENTGSGESGRFSTYDGAELMAPLGDLIAIAQASQNTTQYKILAETVPALNLAAAANPVSAFAPGRNFNMQQRFMTGTWPRSDGRWRHSDLKNIAYPYVHELFDQIVVEGRLAD